MNSRVLQAELLTQKVYLLVLTCLMVILTGSSSEVAEDRMSLFVVVGGVLELIYRLYYASLDCPALVQILLTHDPSWVLHP